MAVDARNSLILSAKPRKRLPYFITFLRKAAEPFIDAGVCAMF